MNEKENEFGRGGTLKKRQGATNVQCFSPKLNPARSGHGHLWSSVFLVEIWASPVWDVLVVHYLILFKTF